MKTIFALFNSYRDAHMAVQELLEQEFPQEEINALVLEEVAKNQMEANLEKVHVNVTDKVGEQVLHGLDQLVGGEQPVQVTGVGQVYAAGDLATILTKRFAGPDPTGLQDTLQEFGVSEKAAAAYESGIKQGGVLIWVRSRDEKAAQAANILSERNGQHVLRNEPR